MKPVCVGGGAGKDEEWRKQGGLPACENAFKFKYTRLYPNLLPLILFFRAHSSAATL